ncbi:MAG: Rieske 2Fe-2S domain-containing protein [Sulfolobaceae archaeon]|nr:Rieske 2Fe-2S domain-containing protein [Sulfolobaceae archaeon]
MDKPFVLKREDLLFLRKLLYKMRSPGTKFDEKEFLSKGKEYLFNYAEKNVGPIDESRRNFLKGILVGISLLSVGGAIRVLNYLTPPEITLKSFPWFVIVDSNGQPIKASQLPVNNPEILLFQYPMQGDITFLINLGDANGNPVEVPPTEVVIPENGKKYTFPGGVGPNKSIVAYSAICQHLGCIPPEIHFYPANLVKPGGTFPDFLPPEAYQAAMQAKAIYGLIHCDCHGSTYDPYKGASVITGPTVRPLPYVQLYWDSNTDYLYAIGMNLKAPVILGRSSDLSGYATLSSYNEQTGCPQQLLESNETPSECYTILQNNGNPFAAQGGGS